MRPHSSRLSNS